MQTSLKTILTIFISLALSNLSFAQSTPAATPTPTPASTVVKPVPTTSTTDVTTTTTATPVTKPTSLPINSAKPSVAPVVTPAATPVAATTPVAAKPTTTPATTTSTTPITTTTIPPTPVTPVATPIATPVKPTATATATATTTTPTTTTTTATTPTPALKPVAVKPVVKKSKPVAKKPVQAPTPTPVAVTVVPTPTPTVVVEPVKTSSDKYSWKGKNTFGVTASGYYEINSDYDSLYFSFPTQNINTAGFGVNTFFEHGFGDRISGEVSLGYSRLIMSNKSRTLVNENYFMADFVAHYYFLNKEKFATYMIGGASVYASSTAVAPMIDIGMGNYFKITDEFSIKAELIFKSAVILNRGEGRVGFAYHF